MGYIVAQYAVGEIMENAVVRARVNEDVKNEAAAILGSMGLTVSGAFRMLMCKIVQEKKLPFSALEPNEETILAMKETNLKSFSNIDDLMADLNEKN